MSVASASNLALRFGPKVLFEGATFSVGAQDRVGLVGANGTGKSSLMKILAGVQSADAGAVTFSRGARPGYLPQDVAELPAGPLVDAVLAGVPGRAHLERRLAATEAALHAASAEDDQLELAQQLADLHAELDHFEERYGRHRAERILGGLGFDDLARDTRALSGGWKMRAALATLLLQDPELLLLDEPTNHLDVPTLEWFDGFLKAASKALVLICHDREFLNRHATRVLSLEPEGLRSYAGNYDDYKRQRAVEKEQLEAQAVRVEKRREELQGFIDRFGAKATKAAQAKSKEKMLERLETVRVLDERKTLRFRFAEPPRSGKEVLKLEGVKKGFGAKVVYQKLDGQILRGERVAVVGANGAGKTTLLKLVAGELAPDAGAVKLGHSVALGYYAQHHFAQGEHGESAQTGTLDPGRTVLETLWDLVPDQGEAYVRGIAGSFLFSGDDVKKKVGVLSGGERARVALAKLLLVPSNLLVMDEPTNHLDLDSSEALIDALKGYEGTLLFVSHNKSFVNQLATQVWDVRGGGVEVWPGNLDEYLYHLRQSGLGGPGTAAGGSAAGGAAPSERDRKRREAEERNARYAREKPLRDEIARLEARIAEVEAAEKAASQELADPVLYNDFARAKPVMERHRAAREELEDLYARWEAASAQLEALSGAA